MPYRRALMLCGSLLAAAGLTTLMVRALAPGGWTVAKAAILGSFALASLWVGFCLMQGVAGYVLLLCRKPPPEAYPLPATRIAIAVTVRNEDMDIVLPPLGQLLNALDAVGAGSMFALFVLSDSSDAAASAEEQAVAAFRGNDPSRIHYRRRRNNDRFKAGNIMEFMDQRADGFPLMLILDADSRMSARAVLRLAAEMEANPHLAIVQHLTVGLPATAAFPRLFQFGMRAGMRTWAAALAWWQGDECCYWGHNALIRIAPFRDHARLPLLPDGRPILSHDQVEAALLAGAGWGIRLLPEEDGSFEANPPALPEFMRRELRWLAGNLEYRHLLRMPGLRAMGRWQLVQAILLFGCTPFYLVILLAASFAAATDPVSPFPAIPVLAVMLAWAGAIYAPKLLGYAEACRRIGTYGGMGRFLSGVLAETVFTLLLDAVSVVGKTATTVRLLLGMRPAWLPQNRGDRGVAWSEAARLLWPHTALGVVAFAGFAAAGWGAMLWAVPLAGGLPMAIPFCVLTAKPWFGTWLRRRGIAAIPEEVLSPDPGP